MPKTSRPIDVRFFYLLNEGQRIPGLMRSGNRAWRGLDALYSTGYTVLRENQYRDARVEGLFVSDSGILFVRENLEADAAIESALVSLLAVVKRMNRSMLEADFMLSTSIAYGHYKYQERIEFIGIEKNPVYGNAYVSAYLDNANGVPRIEPGQCRLVKSGLPATLMNDQFYIGRFGDLVQARAGDARHYYYYWNVQN